MVGNVTCHMINVNTEYPKNSPLRFEFVCFMGHLTPYNQDLFCDWLFYHRWQMKCLCLVQDLSILSHPSLFPLAQPASFRSNHQSSGFSQAMISWIYTSDLTISSNKNPIPQTKKPLSKSKEKGMNFVYFSKHVQG